MGLAPVRPDLVFSIDRAPESKVFPGAPHCDDCEFSVSISKILFHFTLNLIVAMKDLRPFIAESPAEGQKIVVKEHSRLLDDESPSGLQ